MPELTSTQQKWADDMGGAVDGEVFEVIKALDDQPWEHEPDHVEWTQHGFACEIKRSPTTGALCGYVYLPEGHPWHGGYEGLDELVDVHGGFTYGAPKDDGTWCIGFDCSHAGDLCPRMMQHQHWYHPQYDDVYRDIDYVRAEVEKMALAAKKAQTTT